MPNPPYPASLPAGLEPFVIRGSMGRFQAAGRDHLFNPAHPLGFPIRERNTRQAVQPLRQAAIRPASAPGENDD
ncbi:MAG TPA: hypothetical protein VGJ97_00530 [Anaerolineaceae bacterium]